MREYLFRGKRLDNGEWVEGYLVENEDDVYRAFIVCSARWDVDADGDTDLMETEVFEVDPETVGQFTGLTDKNGRKIFEGDIINFSNPRPFKDFVAEVAFDDGCFYLVNKSRYFRDYLKCYTCNHVGEVIGNRWDNPELLEGEG